MRRTSNPGHNANFDVNKIDENFNETLIEDRNLHYHSDNERNSKLPKQYAAPIIKNIKTSPAVATTAKKASKMQTSTNFTTTDDKPSKLGTTIDLDGPNIIHYAPATNDIYKHLGPTGDYSDEEGELTITLLCTTLIRAQHTPKSTLLPNQTTWKCPQKLPFHHLRKPSSTGSTTPAPVAFLLLLRLTPTQPHPGNPSVTQFLCSLHSRGTLRLSSLPFLLSFCLSYMLQLFSLSEPSNNHQGALPQHALQLVHHHQPHSDTATFLFWSLRFFVWPPILALFIHPCPPNITCVSNNVRSLQTGVSEAIHNSEDDELLLLEEMLLLVLHVLRRANSYRRALTTCMVDPLSTDEQNWTMDLEICQFKVIGVSQLHWWTAATQQTRVQKL
jgi:hypothetical protein